MAHVLHQLIATAFSSSYISLLRGPKGGLAENIDGLTRPFLQVETGMRLRCIFLHVILAQNTGLPIERSTTDVICKMK